MKRPDVSIVIPLYNEAGNVGELARQIDAAMAGGDAAWEVIWVDDGSTDDSLARLREIAARDPAARVLRLRRNQGQSAALAAGFDHAAAPVIVTMDADLQNDPADIPRLLAALPGHDLVSGVRATRRDSWLRRVSSALANGVRRRLLDDGVHDVGCSLKAYRAEILRDLPAFNGLHRFLPALVASRGARITEIDVNHRPRHTGVANYGVHNRLWRGLADLAGVAWLRRRRVDRRDVERVAGFGDSAN